MLKNLLKHNSKSWVVLVKTKKKIDERLRLNICSYLN